MGKIFNIIKTLFVGIILMVMLGLTVIFPALTIPFLLLILLGVILMVTRIKKSREKKEGLVPTDLLNNFIQAERRWVDSDGETDPNLIIWEITKQNRQSIRRASEGERAIELRAIPKQSSGRQSIQNDNASEDGRLDSSNEGTKRYNPKRLFRRR